MGGFGRVVRRGSGSIGVEIWGLRRLGVVQLGEVEKTFCIFMSIISVR